MSTQSSGTLVYLELSYLVVRDVRLLAFKTFVMSNRRQSQDGESWRDSFGESDNSTTTAGHLKNLSNHLSVEEKEKLTAAIHGYLLGKKEGASGEPIKKVDFLADPVGGSKALGKIEPVAGTQGKKINVWDKVNKVRTNHRCKSKLVLKFASCAKLDHFRLPISI